MIVSSSLAQSNSAEKTSSFYRLIGTDFMNGAISILHSGHGFSVFSPKITMHRKECLTFRVRNTLPEFVALSMFSLSSLNSFSRHSLQKVCPQGVVTGNFNISEQTPHLNFFRALLGFAGCKAKSEAKA